jgi:hypothetical protein
MDPQFTDEELAFLRHVRFGELPLPPKREELVELVEVDPARDMSAEQTLAHIQYRGQPQG